MLVLQGFELLGKWISEYEPRVNSPYENAIEKLFSMFNVQVEIGLIDKEELPGLEKKYYDFKNHLEGFLKELVQLQAQPSTSGSTLRKVLFVLTLSAEIEMTSDHLYSILLNSASKTLN